MCQTGGSETESLEAMPARYLLSRADISARRHLRRLATIDSQRSILALWFAGLKLPAPTSTINASRAE